MTPRPLWRWLLFCAASWAYARSPRWSRREHWAGKVFGWSVLPEWLGFEGYEGWEEAPW